MTARLQYRVREMFLTLQGEGVWSGTRAVFVRFVGCNVWSGHEKDRARDTSKGFCAAWCDTEFRDTSGPGGGVYTATELASAVAACWRWDARDRVVVLTGGEPTLQVDAALVDALHREGFRVHLETNGSKEPPANIDWVTLSPKPPMPVVLTRDADELKVVLAPGVEPRDYERFSMGPHWIQPCDYGNPNDPRNLQSMAEAARWALCVPGWRLCLQTHKLTGLP